MTTDSTVSVPAQDTTVSVPAQGLGSNRTFGQQLDKVTFGFATVGASNTPGLRFTITGLSLTTATPTVVLVQPRQSDNQDHGFSDEFAVQVISTTQNQITGRVQRLDNPNSGWGQNLRLDFLIIVL
jgi:hypothetical protein